jgi:signal transduction histidine kinase
MISDLLDYTRTRLGAGMPVKPTPMDLAVLGHDLIAEYRAAHPDRAIDLYVDGDVRGRWDSDRIRQAVSNLIGNAVQHGSPDFPVTLSIRGEASTVLIHFQNGGIPFRQTSYPRFTTRSSGAPEPNTRKSIGPEASAWACTSPVKSPNRIRGEST